MKTYLRDLWSWLKGDGEWVRFRDLPREKHAHVTMWKGDRAWVKRDRMPTENRYSEEYSHAEMEREMYGPVRWRPWLYAGGAVVLLVLVVVAV